MNRLRCTPVNRSGLPHIAIPGTKLEPGRHRPASGLAEAERGADQNAARANAVVKFFKWALEESQKQATQLKYVPLPDALAKQIEVYWTSEYAARGQSRSETGAT